MKSLLECDERVPFDGDMLFPGADAVAGLLIFSSMFLMPPLLSALGVGAADVVIFYLFPALMAFALFRWDRVPLKWMTRDEIFEVFRFFLLLLLLNMAITYVWRRGLNHFGFNGREQQVVVGIFRSAGGLRRILTYISVCVMTPLVEELLFRRIIYGWLLNSGKKVAFVMTAVLFSLLHFFLPGVPGLIVLGMGFQLVYLRQKNLTAAVLLHGLNNLCVCLIAG